MEIVNKYEQTYNVKIIDDSVFPPKTYNCVVRAKKIVTTDDDITFIDYYGCVSGCFRRKFVIGYAIKE